MKKFFVWCLSLMLICGSMVACQNEQNQPNDGTSTPATSVPATDNDTVADTSGAETSAPETSGADTSDVSGDGEFAFPTKIDFEKFEVGEEIGGDELEENFYRYVNIPSKVVDEDGNKILDIDATMPGFNNGYLRFYGPSTEAAYKPVYNYGKKFAMTYRVMLTPSEDAKSLIFLDRITDANDNEGFEVLRVWHNNYIETNDGQLAEISFFEWHTITNYYDFEAATITTVIDDVPTFVQPLPTKVGGNIDWATDICYHALGNSFGNDTDIGHIYLDDISWVAFTDAPEVPKDETPSEVVNATVEALKFKNAPTFDGVITEAEWGAPTVTFDKNQAQSYQHHNTGDLDLSATLWLRWDDTYLYIGVTSPEPDGQWCPSKVGDNWNGDTIQVRIDPNGANSTGYLPAPFGEGVINACFAMVTETGAMSKYDHSSVIGGDMTNALFSYALKDGVAAWEIAIPHSDICAKNADALGNIDVDFEYGITVVRLNAEPNKYYNAFLTWGSGVCGPQPDDLCPGSNCVVLSATPAVE